MGIKAPPTPAVTDTDTPATDPKPLDKWLAAAEGHEREQYPNADDDTLRNLVKSRDIIRRFLESELGKGTELRS